jgi:preprotein translocase subunit SecG
MERFPMGIFLGIVMVLLILLSLFIGLVILLQRPRADSGLGAAIGGGGVIDSAFGGDSANVLSKTTVWSLVIFFVGTFACYLGYVRMHRDDPNARRALPAIEVPADTETPPAPTGGLSEPGSEPTLSVPSAPVEPTPAPAPEPTSP